MPAKHKSPSANDKGIAVLMKFLVKSADEESVPVKLVVGSVIIQSLLEAPVFFVHFI